MINCRGKLAISICIVPENEITTKPAGHGRSEPNDNPALPPPFGRFSFNFNPLSLFFAMLSQICGAKVVCFLVCICCTVCFLGVFMFLSTYLSGIEAIIQMMGWDK
jgi:hypothetical protein